MTNFNILELLLGQIPEALFFALFIIFVKELRYNRVKLISLMIIEYVILMNAFPYSIYSHIIFFIVTYILLRILYKDRSNITDVFILGIASILITIVSIISFFMFKNNFILANIFCKLILFLSLFYFKNRLNIISKLYFKLWNRSIIKYRMKSTTFRALNLVVFNISFVIINICMITAILYNNNMITF